MTNGALGIPGVRGVLHLSDFCNTAISVPMSGCPALRRLVMATSDIGTF